ncbi:hypothetical protein [Nonomuraea sp. NPDC049646]|uniref:hypothetical protein n=1 Tax=unclassified Nonomuraea TaxID=2593643 RepID=UPI00378B355E
MRHGDGDQSTGIDHPKGSGQITGSGGGLGRAALWPASVLTAAVTADLLRRRFAPARLRLAEAASGLLERTGVRPARPRLTDRERLDRQLLTWRQAHPEPSWPTGRMGPAGTSSS